MIRVGLTGGIATGKSNVATILRQSGVPVLDADQVAREVVAIGSPALEEIRQKLGARFIQTDGALNRRALRAHVAKHPEARAILEQITHPRIRNRIETWFAHQQAQGARAAVVEAALLFETGSAPAYDKILVVACAPETQLRRLMTRDEVSRSDATAWISTQLPIQHKAERADEVVWNDGTLDELTLAAEAGWASLLSR